MLYNFKRILVPVDGSDLSLQALKYARAFAEISQGSVMVLVVAPVAGTSAEALERARQADSQLVFEPIQAVGDAAAEIVRVAAERRADLIVMTTHGLSGLSHSLLGSVAETVARRAGCPVLTVKPAQHDFLVEAPPVSVPLAAVVPVIDLRKTPPSEEDVYFAKLDRQTIEQAARRHRTGNSVRLSSILAPTDLSALSLAGVAFAGALARRHQSVVHLLHVLDDRAAAHSDLLDAPDLSRSDLVPLGKRLQQLGERLAPALYQPAVAFGSAAHAIAALALEKNADLIVMSTHGRRGLSRMLMGSVAAEVIRIAPCPVLTVHARPSELRLVEAEEHALETASAT